MFGLARTIGGVALGARWLAVSSVAVLGGCVSYEFSGDPEEALNQSLSCAEPACPMHLERDLGYLRLASGYRLDVAALSIDLPTVAGLSVFPLPQSASARTVGLPRISDFSFLVPALGAPVTREEALFVAYLLSASRDEDGTLANPGRAYSDSVEQIATTRSGSDQSKALTDLLRTYTLNLRMRFAIARATVGASGSTYDALTSSWCGAADKLGPTAPINSQTLVITHKSAQDSQQEFTVGMGTDWAYAWTVKGLTAQEVHSGIVIDDDFANAMYHFDVAFPVTVLPSGEQLMVSHCDTVASLAARRHTTAAAVVRRCALAPGEDAYEAAKRPLPCSDGSGDIDLTIRFRRAAGEAGHPGRHVLVDQSVARRMLLAPGDHIHLRAAH